QLRTAARVGASRPAGSRRRAKLVGEESNGGSAQNFLVPAVEVLGRVGSHNAVVEASGPFEGGLRYTDVLELRWQLGGRVRRRIAEGRAERHLELGVEQVVDEAGWFFVEICGL